MQIISYKQPFYLVEIPFLISKTIIYQKDGPSSLKQSKDKVDKITYLYPNFLSDYQQLLKDSSKILKDYPKIVEIHSLLPLGTFTSISYHLPVLDFSKVSLKDFSKAALVALLNTFSEQDFDSSKEIKHLSEKMLNHDGVNLSLLLNQLETFDLEVGKKYEILHHFNEIESIFQDYRKMYFEILKLYMEFYQLYKICISDNKTPKRMADLNLEQWIDLDSFKDHSSDFFYFSFSLINYHGLSAKLAVRDDELSFGMQGVFVSLFKEIDKENTVSISDVELQMSALGDSKRIQIFALLYKDEHYLKELADALELSSSTLSHHMDILQSAGLVKMRAKGKRVYYSLNPQEIQFIANFFQKVAGSLESNL